MVKSIQNLKKKIEYAKEASEFAPKDIFFLMLNAKMQESRAAMNNKSTKAETKQEVDTFTK